MKYKFFFNSNGGEEVKEYEFNNFEEAKKHAKLLLANAEPYYCESIEISAEDASVRRYEVKDYEE